MFKTNVPYKGSACLEHLAPTDGTPGIGTGCQIKLALKAAGEVNWRLGIQVDIGCRTPSSVPKSRCSRDLKLCWPLTYFLLRAKNGNGQ